MSRRSWAIDRPIQATKAAALITAAPIRGLINGDLPLIHGITSGGSAMAVP